MNAPSSSADQLATRGWLTKGEMRVWLGFLQAGTRVLQLISSGIKERSGLTLDDYEVLVNLSEAEENRIRVTQLAQMLMNSQARLTQRVNRLEKRGLVTREPCEDDGRGVYVVLGEDGRAELERLAPFHVEDVRRLLLDQVEVEEMEPLAVMLERIDRAAREEQGTNQHHLEGRVKSARKERPGYMEPTAANARILARRSDDGPITMLNLLKFREIADYSATPELQGDGPVSGAEAYARYVDEAMGYLVESGGEVLFAGSAGDYFIGPPNEGWDHVMVVRQRSLSDFFAFQTTADYQAILGHRLAALADSRLLPMWETPSP